MPIVGSLKQRIQLAEREGILRQRLLWESYTWRIVLPRWFMRLCDLQEGDPVVIVPVDHHRIILARAPEGVANAKVAKYDVSRCKVYVPRHARRFLEEKWERGKPLEAILRIVEPGILLIEIEGQGEGEGEREKEGVN